MFCQLIQKIIWINQIHLQFTVTTNIRLNSILEVSLVAQHLIRTGMGSKENLNLNGDDYNVVDMDISLENLNVPDETCAFKRIARSLSTDRLKEEITELHRSRSQIVLNSSNQYQTENNLFSCSNFYYPADLQNQCYTKPIFLNNSVNTMNTNKNYWLKTEASSSFTHKSINKKDDSVPKRKWESRRNDTSGFHFTVMSYNVLAQDLLNMHPYLYKRHNPMFLKWEVRWLNILKEIGEHDPDIICFQEVQESHLNDYFSILENKLGYKTIYKKRTGIRTDGCAIYYKKKRLSLSEYQKIEYFHQDVAVLNRDNVAIVAKFRSKEHHTKSFVVATTHLLYNPNREDVRLAQTLKLMAEIDKIAYKGTNTDDMPYYIPIIITGDLNTTPNSIVYDLITNGMVRYEYLLRSKEFIPKKLKLSDNCQYVDVVKERYKNHEIHKNIPFSTGTLTHNFCFSSAYHHILNNDNLATTFQNKWVTVDYIFYSQKRHLNKKLDDRLKLTKVFRLPSSQDLHGITIPNGKLGSDHFSLLAQFKLE